MTGEQYSQLLDNILRTCFTLAVLAVTLGIVAIVIIKLRDEYLEGKLRRSDKLLRAEQTERENNQLSKEVWYYRQFAYQGTIPRYEG